MGNFYSRQSVASPMFLDARTISHQGAQKAAWAAIEEAEVNGININVAVVDNAGVLIAFVRMPGASFHSAETAKDKAYTAASFGFPTAEWENKLAEFSETVQKGLLARPRLITFGGGIPLFAGDCLVGAIGVSGASVELDELCAQAGVKAYSQA